MTDTARTVRPTGGADRRGSAENPSAPDDDRTPATPSTWGGEDVRVPALILAALALFAAVLPALQRALDPQLPVELTWLVVSVGAEDLLLVPVAALAVLLVVRRGPGLLVAAPLMLTVGAALVHGAAFVALGLLADGLGTQGQMSEGYRAVVQVDTLLPPLLLGLAGIAATVLAVRHPVAPPTTRGAGSARALAVGLLAVLALMLVHGIAEALGLRAGGGGHGAEPLLPVFGWVLVLLAVALLLGGLLADVATGPLRSAVVAVLAVLGACWVVLVVLGTASGIASMVMTGTGDTAAVLLDLRQGLRTVGLAVAAGAGALAVAVALPSRRR